LPQELEVGGPVETKLLVQADRLVGGSDAVLVIDDTAIPKKGTHSVGVAPQYASALGKTANCQTLVSLTLARVRCPSYWRCGCFFPRVGRASGLVWSERVFRPNVERHERNRKRLWRRSIVPSRPVCALAACWRWAERAVPSGAHSSQTCLGSRYSPAPQGVPCRCADDLASCKARSSPSAARPEGAPRARNSHSTAPFATECQSFLDNIIARAWVMGLSDPSFTKILEALHGAE